MKKIPNMIFVIDTNTDSIAIKESLKLNIPIVAIIDTNSDPTGITYPIPGNDDARRAINLYCELVKQTILDAQKHIMIKETEESKPKEKSEESKLEKKKETTKKSFESKNSK